MKKSYYFPSGDLFCIYQYNVTSGKIFLAHKLTDIELVLIALTRIISATVSKWCILNQGCGFLSS